MADYGTSAPTRATTEDTTSLSAAAETPSKSAGHTVVLTGDAQSVSIALDAIYGVINIATALLEQVHQPSPTTTASPLFTQIRANAMYLEQLGLVLLNAVDDQQQPAGVAYQAIWGADMRAGGAA